MLPLLQTSVYITLVAMSATSTPNDSPVGTPIQPLHNPAQAAHVVVPQAPLGNATNGQFNQAPGMGAKALLAKKFAKSQYVVHPVRPQYEPQSSVSVSPVQIATPPMSRLRTT